MSQNRYAIRFGISLILGTLLCLPVFAQDPPQAEIDFIHSLLFENLVTEDPDSTSCRPVKCESRVAKQNAEWIAMWSDDSPKPQCNGSECNQTSSSQECMNNRLGMLGTLVSMSVESENCDSESCAKNSCEPGCCSQNQKCPASSACDNCETCPASTGAACKECVSDVVSFDFSFDADFDSAKSCDDCNRACHAEQSEQCSGCEDKMIARKYSEMECKENGCSHIADLLQLTLRSQELDEVTKRMAIEKAMLLAFEKGRSQSQMEMEQMKVAHTNELAVLRGKNLQMSTQIRTVDDVRNWINPLYTNQNRTMQHLQMMGSSSAALHRTLNLLEKQLSNSGNSFKPAVKFTNPHVSPATQQDVVYDLKREVSQLKRQLKELQMTEPARVLPAQHLQPVFKPKSQLEPLEPLEINWPSETTYRR